MPKPLVIVESPTKKTTIQKILGPNYMVEASVGHIRDLPAKPADLPAKERAEGYNADFAVHIEQDFKPCYVLADRAKPNIAKLKALLREASELVLATDEDREGESISWHLLEVLTPRVPVKRMVFHEITADAVRHALANPRALDHNLVQAQETRRVLDRIVGYGISPVLWRKVRGATSAGRVQSPAVRLLVERERERMAFRSSTWWDVEAEMAAKAGRFGATLDAVGGRRIARARDFDETTGRLADPALLLLDEIAATNLATRLGGASGRVTEIEEKPWRERPFPPFTTSTLQMEANRKLRWAAKHTMSVAQKLYEEGWITYMRTDSVALSEQAIAAARGLIAQQYGADHLPSQPRRYKSTAKNAQEAHEAIRPAGTSFRSIEEARRELPAELARLYELVWKRTVASQMEDAHGLQMSVRILVPDAGGDVRFVATGRTIRFAGFQRAYVEGSDDPEADLAERERILPPLAVGDTVSAASLTPKGHTTQPPPRLTEASLVKELERRGIGRPSTYADIIEKILDRAYAFKRQNALVPTHLAMLVVSFLESELGDLVSYDFTARVEDDLDRIALGNKKRSAFLHGFYLGESGLRQKLDAALKADATALYRLPLAGSHAPELHVRVGQYGAYVAHSDGRTANVAKDMAPDEVTEAWAVSALQAKADGPARLGTDAHGTPIFLMNGRFGPYVQLGEGKPAGKGKKAEAPKRASLLPGMSPSSLTVADARALLALPRTIGKDAAGQPVIASNGKYGPYIKRGEDTRSLPAGVSALHVTLEEALALLAAPKAGGRAKRGPPQALRELGADPVTGGAIKLMDGRFGPYVTDGTTNATLPRGTRVEEFSAESAAALLQKKREAGPAPKRGRWGGRGSAKAPTPKAESTRSAVAKSAGPKAKAGKSAAPKAKPEKAAGPPGLSKAGNSKSASRPARRKKSGDA